MSINKKNFIWNIIGTTISSFNSLFFMIVVTRVNGVDAAGIFSFGFSFACLFYIIGIYSGRVFQVTDTDEENDSFSYINNHIISCFLMLILAVIFCLIRNYSGYKFLIVVLLVIFKMLEAFSETLYAVIQLRNKLYKVGISLFIKAIIGLMLFILIEVLSGNLIISILSVILVNLFMILLYDFKSTSLDLRNYKFDMNRVIKLFKIGFWAFAFTFLNLYLINLSKYLIDFFCTDDVQTFFGILVMPATVVSMFAQFIIHPMLLNIKEYISNYNIVGLTKLIRKLSLAIIAFGICAVTVMYFVGIQVLNLIYGISLNGYRLYLIIVLVGATFYSIMVIFSNVLTAFRKTISQTIVYAILSIICTFISFILINKYSIQGAIYSYLISMISLFISFLILTYKILIDFKKERC